MKPVRCRNGHYYDADLYKNCPHCDDVETDMMQNGVHCSEKKTKKTAGTKDVKPGKEKKRDSFLSFIKAHGNSAVKSGKEDDNTVTDLYSCEPTVAMSGDELLELLQRNLTDEAGVPVDCADKTECSVSKPVKYSAESENNNLPASDAEITFDGTEDTAAYAVNVRKTQYECPETVGLFNNCPGEAEPCVGWLTAVSGVYRGRSFELKAGGNFIGRSSENDIVLSDDNRVSRFRHARVAYEPRSGEFYIETGESGGLAYLNGKNILHHAELSAGDMIEIGGGCYIFVPLCSKSFSWENFPPAYPVCRGV